MITIVDARRDRLAHEMVIDVGTEPVRVGELVTRTRGDEEPLRIEAAIGERLTGMMSVECEAALQPAAHVGDMRKPAAARGHVVAVRQPVAHAEALERKIRERRRRLAYGEARVRSPLQQDDVEAKYGQH